MTYTRVNDFGPYMDSIFRHGRLICGATYTQVYTVAVGLQLQIIMLWAPHLSSPKHPSQDAWLPNRSHAGALRSRCSAECTSLLLPMQLFRDITLSMMCYCRQGHILPYVCQQQMLPCAVLKHWQSVKSPAIFRVCKWVAAGLFCSQAACLAVHYSIVTWSSSVIYLFTVTEIRSKIINSS